MFINQSIIHKVWNSPWPRLATVLLQGDFFNPKVKDDHEMSSNAFFNVKENRLRGVPGLHTDGREEFCYNHELLRDYKL